MKYLNSHFVKNKRLLMPIDFVLRNRRLSALFLFLVMTCAPTLFAQDLKLSVVQERVYKLADSTKLNSESWMFHTIINGSGKADDITLIEGKLELRSLGELKQTIILSSGVLAGMRQTTFLVTEETLGSSIRRRYGQPELLDLRFDLANIPVAWKTDMVRLTLRLRTRDNPETSLTVDVPIHVYEQKTKLFSPIKGPAIVSQGRFNNGGHSGFGNQFAIDFLGLTPNYAPMNRDGEANADYSGWGREVFAAADGEVVYARNDVPDNPPNADPATVFSKEHDPIDATAGNAVIIGHGNGEFSVMMHMQKGSVRVKKGNKVKKGDLVGLIGNSGDSFGPHLHFQLQNGPELFKYPTLPFEFEDLKGRKFARGEYFSAK